MKKITVTCLPIIVGICLVVSTLARAGMFSPESAGGADAASAEETMPEIAFAFADESGTRVMLITREGAVPDPTALNVAILPGGEAVRAEYLGRNPGNDQDSYRDSAMNFPNREGEMYNLGKAMAPDEVCLLVNYTFLEGRVPLTIRSMDNVPMPPEQLKAVEKDKGWQAEESWGLVSIRDTFTLWLVHFKRQGDQCLASLVLVGPKGRSYLDFPAEYDEYSTWRVDDGGEIWPEAFKVILALATNQGVELAVNWGAPEGESIRFVRQEGNELIIQLHEARYLSPM